MPLDERKPADNKGLWLAAIAIAAGLALSGASLIKLQARGQQAVAEATPTPQASPAAEPTSPPAEAEPGGTRPTTPAPEPAHPDPQAQKAGATPVLPNAPAEKMAPPIQEKGR